MEGIAVTLNASLAAAIQSSTLQRVFREALFPRLLYRLEAIPEVWAQNLGQSSTFTRKGTIEPSTRPVTPNQDPPLSDYDIEQWSVTASQYGRSIDTHMPTSYVSLASVYLANVHQLGLNAGQSLNRIFRDAMFNAYVGGNTVTTAVETTTSLAVANLPGFVTQLKDGQQQAISPSNALLISIPFFNTGGAPALGVDLYQVTAVSPAVAGDFIHAGTLTITPTLAGSLPAGSAVLAANRSRIVYSGGGNSVEDVTTANQFRLADVRAAVAQMQFDNIPAHEDGSYHLHLDPISKSQIFGDNEFQRIHQGQAIPGYVHYERFAIAHMLGCTFYDNTEAPTSATCSQNPLTGATTGFALTNSSGVAIHRPIFTGQGTLEEKYLDESKYISEAGVQGKIGEFSINNSGVQVLTERIRLILRAPQDRFQQLTSTTWSWSGSPAVPTDATATSSPAAFKRAVVVVHG